MNIDRQDLYHGAALLQIIEKDHHGPVITKSPPGPYYNIWVGSARKGKESRYIYIKYVSKNSPPFRFVFSQQERDFLEEQFAGREPVFVVLVCGPKHVCVLNRYQYLELEYAPGRMTLVVETPPGGKMRVSRWGSKKKPTLVAHNDFPKDVLA
jgi:hypothetical protein